MIVSNSNVAVESVVKNITTSELVETSISTSVDKVYGSTVIIMAYKNGQQVSTGTGFVYKKDNNKAYIMTNNHVVDNADEVKVEFNDKSEKIDAKIIGGDAYSDIAVLAPMLVQPEFYQQLLHISDKILHYSLIHFHNSDITFFIFLLCQIVHYTLPVSPYYNQENPKKNF